MIHLHLIFLLAGRLVTNKRLIQPLQKWVNSEPSVWADLLWLHCHREKCPHLRAWLWKKKMALSFKDGNIVKDQVLFCPMPLHMFWKASPSFPISWIKGNFRVLSPFFDGHHTLRNFFRSVHNLHSNLWQCICAYTWILSVTRAEFVFFLFCFVLYLGKTEVTEINLEF